MYLKFLFKKMHYISENVLWHDIILSYRPASVRNVHNQSPIKQSVQDFLDFESISAIAKSRNPGGAEHMYRVSAHWGWSWLKCLTCLADLGGAAAAPVAHDGYKAGIEAGAPLLAAAAAHCAERRIWLAAIRTLRSVDVAAYTCAL